MFKTTKTQFAIRKLAQGAVAVLLSFGILAGPSAPIVSAATETAQSEVVSETQTESSGDTQSDVVIETEPTETENTEETAVTETTTPASDETSTENDKSTEVPVESDATAPAETDTQEVKSTNETKNTNVETVKSEETTDKVETENTDESTKSDKEDSNEKEDTDKSEDTGKDDNNDKPATSDKLSQVNIKDFYGEDGKIDATKLSNHLKEVADKHPLGIAGIFHIFAEEVNSSSHIAGNIAADKITAGDFSTNQSAGSNLTLGDIHYIGDVAQFNQFSHNANKIVILGPDITFEKNSDSNRVTITDANGNKKELLNVSFNNVISAKDLNFKIDIKEELNNLGEKFDKIAEDHKDENKVDFSGVDQNNRVIDISNMKTNEDGTIYINIDAADLHKGTPITIKNIKEDGPGIIINVRTESGIESIVVDSQIKLHYVGMTNDHFGNAEKHDQTNKILWNFGSNIENIQFNNTFMGSVLATGAEIKIGHNIDGNIVGNKLSVTGETHRWDLVTEIQKPDPKPDPDPEPDPKPDPEPDPKPDPEPDPKPDPKPDPEPDPKPDPEPDPKPDPEPDPKPDPEPDPKPDPEPDPKPDPEPDPKPDPEPDPEPTPTPDPTPTPENPTPVEPKPEETPKPGDNTESFTPPLEEDVIAPKPEETPTKEESSEEKATRPLPETPVEKLDKKETVTPKASVVPTSVKTETQTEVKGEPTNQVALPETGEKQNHLITTGIILAGLATAMTLISGVIKKKKN